MASSSNNNANVSDESDESESVSESESDETKEEYKKKSLLPSSFGGTLFQVRLLILVLQRAVFGKYDFKLTTEMEIAELFDDLVFQYKKKDANRVIFLQAKHKSKIIKFADLCTKNKDFSLVKYFYSYRKIMQRPEFEKSVIKDFILFTNIDLDKINIGVKKEEANDFLKFIGENPACYKLTFENNKIGKKKNKNNKKDLYNVLRRTDLYMLANALVNCVKHRTKLTYRGIFKSYHIALMNEGIIDIKKDGKNFTGEFIIPTEQDAQESNISESAKMLMIILKEHLSLEVLRDSKLKVSKDFVSKFDPCPDLENVYNFVNRIVNWLKNADNFKVNNPLNITILTKINLDKLAGHVLVTKNNNVQFSDAFLDVKSTLKGNLENFRTMLLERLKQEDALNSLSQYTFCINNFKTWEESNIKLPDSTSDDEIKVFLEKLILAVNQPNVDELGRIVTDEIGKEFNLMDSELLADHILKEMLNWVKNSTGSYLKLEEGKNILDLAKKKVLSLMSVYATKQFEAEMETFSIKFLKKNLDDLNLGEFLMDQNENKVLGIVTDYVTPIAIMLFQIIKDITRENIKQYEKDGSYIYVPLKSFILVKDCILNAFELTSNLLVIECLKDDDVNNIRTELLEIINNEKGIKKKVILLIEKGNNLDNIENLKKMFGENCIKKKHNASIKNLCKDSKLLLLQNGKFMLQEQEISLDLSDKTLVNLIDNGTFVKLIKGETCNIGKKLQTSSDFGEDFYIERFFTHEFFIQTRQNCKFDNNTYFSIDITNQKTLCKLNKRIKYNVLKKEEKEKLFQKLDKENPDENKLWIKIDSAADNYVDINDSQIKVSVISEELLLDQCWDNNHKVIIISNASGMGKSTVLNSLSKKLIEFKSSVWIITVDLGNFTDVLKKEKENRSFSNNKKKAINFLFNTLLESEEQKLFTKFEMKLFGTKLVKKALFFYGFDEIYAEYKEIVIDLLKELIKCEDVQLFITSRPNLQQYLKDQLEGHVYPLEPFSENEQLQFLENIWKRNLGVTRDLTRIQIYAKTLINEFNKCIKDDEKGFTGNPRQLRILAEIFQENTEGSDWQGCKEFVNDDSANPLLTKQLDLIYFQHFERRK